MANKSPKTNHLRATQWKVGQSGNPAGKPRGTKHLSTWIQEMMENDTFEQQLRDGSIIKVAPVKAIVATLIVKAVEGDLKAFDLLGKYGYGTKIDLTSMDEQLPTPVLVNMARAMSDEQLDEIIERAAKRSSQPSEHVTQDVVIE